MIMHGGQEEELRLSRAWLRRNFMAFDVASLVAVWAAAWCRRPGGWRWLSRLWSLGTRELTGWTSRRNRLVAAFLWVPGGDLVGGWSSSSVSLGEALKPSSSVLSSSCCLSWRSISVSLRWRSISASQTGRIVWSGIASLEKALHSFSIDSLILLEWPSLAGRMLVDGV